MDWLEPITVRLGQPSAGFSVLCRRKAALSPNYLILPFGQMSDVDKNFLSAGKIFHRVETTRSQSEFINSFAAALTGSSQGSVQSSFHTPRNR